MDEREIEQGYANFHRRLNRVLRLKDVKAFKAHVASHPHQAGRLTHCLMLNDELAEIEMYRLIVVRSALKDIHQEAIEWLRTRGIDPPMPKLRKGSRGSRKPFRRGRKF